jgi:FixJ family two-component response regulator
MTNFSTFEAGTAGTVTALSVFPRQEDHTALRSIFRSSDWPLCPGFNWALKTSKTLDEALPILRNDRISVVLCERDLHPGTWKDMVEALALLPDPPYLIVTSRQADERLWVEALNLGAFDVLQMPFNAAEVTRSLGMAWLRWADRRRPVPAKVLARVARSVA